jgi:hypothetical protein
MTAKIDQCLEAGRYDLALEASAIEGFSQGEKAERQRIKSILGDPAAVGRERAALHLALETDLPATAAALVLASAPRPTFADLRFPRPRLAFDADAESSTEFSPSNPRS